MFFKDKFFWQGAILLAACVSGLLFPTFIKYLFGLGGVVGIGSMAFAVLKYYKVLGDAI